VPIEAKSEVIQVASALRVYRSPLVVPRFASVHTSSSPFNTPSSCLAHEERTRVRTMVTTRFPYALS